MEYRITTEDLKDYVEKLNIGDRVLLSGTVYTSRDAAHKRICSSIEKNERLPYELKEAVIYYAGPTPAPDGLATGACGPTTASRMDPFTPKLLDLGVRAMIGKGERSKEVINSIKKNNAVYFCAIGGAGALAAKCIKECTTIAYEDLGCEAVRRLLFDDFPLIVAVDCNGGNIFDRTKK